MVGLIVRLSFLALTPTLYGVENDIFYVPNSVVGAGFDGWATLLAAAIGFGTYTGVALLRPRTTSQVEATDAELAAVSAEAAVKAEPVPAPA